jgi:hypothetical protein
MSMEQQTSIGQQSDERFLSVLGEVTSLKDAYIAQQLQGYLRNAARSRLTFRYTGILIIILSVSLPYLTTLKGVWLSIVLPIVALLVAGLTGLNSFYRWESSWKGYSQMAHSLEYTLKLWEIQIIKAKHEQDPLQAIELAVQATKDLVESAHTTITAEDEEFFKRVQFPQIHKN